MKIVEIWWCAVDPSGTALWPYLELRRKDVVERLAADHPAWRKDGWRVAKLSVVEFP